MNEIKAANFINSLVKSLQVLCHSNVDFNQNIEVIGHLYLNIDSSKKINYIVNEKVCKNDEASTIFVSNSFHAEETKQKVQPEPPSTHQNEKIQIKDSYVRNSSNNIPNSREFRPHYDSGNNINVQQRHKRSLSIDTSNQMMESTSAKFYRKDPPFNALFHRSVSPTFLSNTSQHATPTSRAAVDLSRVKLEPVDDLEPSLPCIFASPGGDEPVMHSQTTSKTQLHSPSMSSSNFCDTGQSPKNNNFTNIIENATELYPIGILNMSNSIPSTNSQTNTVLPSISTLTNSRFGNTSLSSGTMHTLGYERHTLSIDDKFEIIKAAESVEKPSQTALAFMFGVSQPAINRILKKRDIYILKYQQFHQDSFQNLNS